MKTLLSVTFLLFVMTSFSQTLRPEAKKVKVAYDKLALNKSSKSLQTAYIDAFPSDAKTFLNVFNSAKFDQLYSNYPKYLEAFELSGESIPEQVITKCLNIGKDLKWEADAVGQLQHLSVSLAVKHSSIFISKYNSLTPKERHSLIAFYADVENHASYEIYQKLIEKLEKEGAEEVAEKFEMARARRQKQRDH